MSYSPAKEGTMKSLHKQIEDKVRAPVRKTGREPDLGEMHDRVMNRFPKTMARLGK